MKRAEVVDTADKIHRALQGPRLSHEAPRLAYQRTEPAAEGRIQALDVRCVQSPASLTGLDQGGGLRPLLARGLPARQERVPTSDDAARDGPGRRPLRELTTCARTTRGHSIRGGRPRLPV